MCGGARERKSEERDKNQSKGVRFYLFFIVKAEDSLGFRIRSLLFLPVTNASLCPSSEQTWRSVQKNTIMILKVLFQLVIVQGLSIFLCDSLSIDPNELEILQNLYSSTDGPNWVYGADQDSFGTPWFTEEYPDPCYAPWQGVLCFTLGADCDNNCHIFSLSMANMNLRGYLPPTMFNFTDLLFLKISENPQLKGTIPPILSMPVIQSFNLSYNALQGPIPPVYTEAPFLELIYLSNNHLTGPIPSSVFAFPNLKYLYLLRNEFTNSIPPIKYANLSQLVFLNLGYNKLTSTIPESMKDMKDLTNIYLNNNLLEGSLPSFYNDNITELSVEYNRLSGKFCPTLGAMRRLELLRLNDNQFTGEVPPMQTLSELQVLQLQNNKFHGRISALFDPKSQKKLTNLDISGNAFSGTLPPELFQLPNLQTIAAVKNCFHGELPETICEARHLQVLAMDGLTSADRCMRYLWDPLDVSKAYFTSKMMHGHIPSCVWTLPNLTTLHLSGNALSGSLAASASVSTATAAGAAVASSDVVDTNAVFDASYTSSLVRSSSRSIKNNDNKEIIAGETDSGQTSSSTSSAGNGYPAIAPIADLSLSFNSLSGEIPKFIKELNYSDLDLSHNRFRGNLDGFSVSTLALNKSETASSAKLNLEVNRLTGYIPSSFDKRYGLKILDGNVFACTGQDALPQHDPNAKTYSCGSDQLDRAMFSLAVGLLLFVLCVASWVVLRAVFSYRTTAEGGRNCSSSSSSSTSSSSLSSENVRRQKTAVNGPFWTDCAVGNTKGIEYEQLYGLSFTARCCRTISIGWTKIMYTLRTGLLIFRGTSTSMFVGKSPHSYYSRQSIQFYEMSFNKYPNWRRFLNALSLQRLMVFGVAAFVVLCCLPAYLILFLSHNDSQYSTLNNRYSWTYSSVYSQGSVPTAVFFVLWSICCISCALAVIITFEMYRGKAGNVYPYVYDPDERLEDVLVAGGLDFTGNNIENEDDNFDGDRETTSLSAPLVGSGPTTYPNHRQSGHTWQQQQSRLGRASGGGGEVEGGDTSTSAFTAPDPRGSEWAPLPADFAESIASAGTAMDKYRNDNARWNVASTDSLTTSSASPAIRRLLSEEKRRTRARARARSQSTGSSSCSRRRSRRGGLSSDGEYNHRTPKRWQKTTADEREEEYGEGEEEEEEEEEDSDNEDVRTSRQQQYSTYSTTSTSTAVTAGGSGRRQRIWSTTSAFAFHPASVAVAATVAARRDSEEEKVSSSSGRHQSNIKEDHVLLFEQEQGPLVGSVSVAESISVAGTGTVSGTSESNAGGSGINIRDTLFQFNHQEGLRQKLKFALKYFLVTLFNVVLVGIVNGIYIIQYQSSDNFSSYGKIAVQMAMAIFKLLWNSMGVRWLIGYLTRCSASCRLHVNLLIFNVIFAPCLLTALTDTNCFNSLVTTTPSTISTSYEFATCLEKYQALVNGVLETYCTSYSNSVYVTNFTPPFVYTYNCASSILAAYIPVYIYTYAMLLFVIPLMYLFVATLDATSICIPSFVLRAMDGVFRPQDRETTASTSEAANNSNNNVSPPPLLLKHNNLLQAYSVQALLVQHLVVALTFGVFSPFLAVTVALAIWTQTIAYQMVLLRYVEFQSRSSCFHPLHWKNDALDGVVVPAALQRRMSSLSNLKQEAREQVQLQSQKDGGGEGRGGDNSRTATTTATAAAPAATSSRRVTEKSVVAVTSDIYQEERHPQQQNELPSSSGSSRAFLSSAVAVDGDNGDTMATTAEEEDSHAPLLNSRPAGAYMSEIESDNFMLTATDEELRWQEDRLFELDCVCGDSWATLKASVWVIVACCLLFYGIVLFDVLGTSAGLMEAAMVPVASLCTIVTVRLTAVPLCKRYMTGRW